MPWALVKVYSGIYARATIEGVSGNPNAAYISLRCGLLQVANSVFARAVPRGAPAPASATTSASVKLLLGISISLCFAVAMVKKVAPPAGSPVRARGVKKQGSKARSPRKPRNKWLNVPAKACSICRQTTHEADRDFREFVWLEWIKCRFTTYGAELPHGNECYRCYTCRRRHFTAFKLKNLRGEMQKDPSLRDKFEEARKDDIQQWSGIQNYPGVPKSRLPPTQLPKRSG